MALCLHLTFKHMHQCCTISKSFKLFQPAISWLPPENVKCNSLPARSEAATERGKIKWSSGYGNELCHWFMTELLTKHFYLSSALGFNLPWIFVYCVYRKRVLSAFFLCCEWTRCNLTFHTVITMSLYKTISNLLVSCQCVDNWTT